MADNTSTSLPYIPLDPHLLERRKMLLFEDLMSPRCPGDVPGTSPGRLWTYPVCLWMYAGRSAVDGNLGRLSANSVAKICNYDGDPELLLSALLGSEFLDQLVDGALVVHNWHKYGGRLLESREKWVEKKRRQRAAKSKSEKRIEEIEQKQNARNCPPGHPGDVPETSRPKGKGKDLSSSSLLSDHAQDYTLKDLEPLAWHWGWTRRTPTPRQLQVAQSLSPPWAAEEVERAYKRTVERCASDKSDPNLGLFLALLGDERRPKPELRQRARGQGQPDPQKFDRLLAEFAAEGDDGPSRVGRAARD